MLSSEIVRKSAPASYKIEYLDGLRGLGALVVVCAHFRDLLLPTMLGTSELTPIALLRTPLMLLVASHAAVRIFFLHSGFVLAWKYVNTGETNLLVSMAARRVFRLGIPVAASIFFAYALMAAGAMRNRELSDVVSGVSPLAAHYSFRPSLETAAADAFGGWFIWKSFRYNGALWTMPIELTCSYLVFLLAPFAFRAARVYVVAGALLLSAVLLFTDAAVASYFVVGMTLARLWRTSDGSAAGVSETILRYRLLFAGVAVVALTVAAWPHSLSRALPDLAGIQKTELLQLAAVTVLFIGLLISVRLQWVFGSRMMRFLGRTSFFAYLLHLPILCSFSSGVFLALSSAGVPRWTSVAVTFVSTLAVTYLVADLMSRTIDRFAINFGKPFLARHLNRAPWNAERKSSTAASG